MLGGRKRKGQKKRKEAEIRVHSLDSVTFPIKEDL